MTAAAVKMAGRRGFAADSNQLDCEGKPSIVQSRMGLTAERVGEANEATDCVPTVSTGWRSSYAGGDSTRIDGLADLDGSVPVSTVLPPVSRPSLEFDRLLPAHGETGAPAYSRAPLPLLFRREGEGGRYGDGSLVGRLHHQE